MEPAPPSQRLASQLAALGNPVRLDLLRALRTPQPVGQVAVGGLDGHTIARQAVRGHLDRLIEAGFVTMRESGRDARSPLEYVVNHQQIFALSEAIRGLARLRPVVEPSLATADLALDAPASPFPKPCLVLVKGLEEGAVFPLRETPGSPRSWIIGRKRGVAIPLDFDPFVSAENCRIDEEEAAFFLEDLPESRNGAMLNYRPLPKGRRAQLRHGDLVGVGRSVLLFRDA